MMQCSIVTLEYNLLLLTPKHCLFKVCSRPSWSHCSPFCHDITGIKFFCCYFIILFFYVDVDVNVVVFVFDDFVPVVNIVFVVVYVYCYCCCCCYSCFLIARLAIAGWGLQLDGHQGHDIKPMF